MAKRKRLPALPDGLDPTDKKIVQVLLDLYADEIEITGEFDFNDAVLLFLSLMEQEYPAAMKDYIDHHVMTLLSVRLRRHVGEQKALAKRRKRLSVFGSDVSVADTFNSVGNGMYRSVMKRNRHDLKVVASRYRSIGVSAHQEADFAEALAARLTDEEQVVEDVWTRDEVEDLYADIVGDDTTEGEE